MSKRFLHLIAKCKINVIVYPFSWVDSPASLQSRTCRLLDDISNYENMIEQLNSEKKKMNVKVHAADTYLTQVKELESAYRLDLYSHICWIFNYS